MRMQNLVYRTRLIPVRPRVWEGEGTVWAHRLRSREPGSDPPGQPLPTSQHRPPQPPGEQLCAFGDNRTSTHTKNVKFCLTQRVAKHVSSPEAHGTTEKESRTPDHAGHSQEAAMARGARGHREDVPGSGLGPARLLGGSR